VYVPFTAKFGPPVTIEPVYAPVLVATGNMAAVAICPLGSRIETAMFVPLTVGAGVTVPEMVIVELTGTNEPVVGLVMVTV